MAGGSMAKKSESGSEAPPNSFVDKQDARVPLASCVSVEKDDTTLSSESKSH
jgi:hypothetical protein